MSKKETIWQAMYCPCVHESAAWTLSVHRTREGARRAMIQHKLKERKLYKEYYDMRQEKADNRLDYEFEVFKDWEVSEIELKD